MGFARVAPSHHLRFHMWRHSLHRLTRTTNITATL